MANSDLAPYGGPGGQYDLFGSGAQASVTVELTGLFSNVNRGSLALPREIAPYSELSPIGTPIGRYAFSDSEATEITGFDVTVSIGSIVATSAVQLELDLDPLTASIDTLAVSIPLDVTPDGVSATGSTNGVQVGESAATTIIGLQSEAELGNLDTDTVVDRLNSDLGLYGAPSYQPDFSERIGSISALPIGAFATGATNAVSLSTDQVITPDSATATGQAGDFTAEADQVITLDEVISTGQIGTLSVPIADPQRDDVSDLSIIGVPGDTYDFSGRVDQLADVTETLTGVFATSEIALFDASSVEQEPDGASGTGQAGDTDEGIGQVITLAAVSATGSANDVINPASADLTGFQTQSTLGGISASAGGDTSEDISSTAITTDVGTLSADIDVIITPDGVVSTGDAGVLEPAFVNVFITGVQAVGQAGEFFARTQNKGGLTKKQRRQAPAKRYYVVEVDGQDFIATTMAEVRYLLEQARLLAEQSATEDVREAVTPTKVELPRIRVRTAAGNQTASIAIQREVKQTRDAIKKTYNKAAEMEQRIRDLERAQARDDEEEAVIALLM